MDSSIENVVKTCWAGTAERVEGHGYGSQAAPNHHPKAKSLKTQRTKQQSQLHSTKHQHHPWAQVLQGYKEHNIVEYIIATTIMAVKRTWLRKELRFQCITRARNWETRSSNKTLDQVSSDSKSDCFSGYKYNMIWISRHLKMKWTCTVGKEWWLVIVGC